MEIERQFLVNFIPPLPEDYEQLRQGYISLEPEIRIRQAGDHQFFLTVKRGNGLAAELHLHGRHLAGFHYVEVEFPSEEQARAFEPPDWFGREVTDDVRFSYGMLAKTDGLRMVKKLLEGQGEG